MAVPLPIYSCDQSTIRAVSVPFFISRYCPRSIGRLLDSSFVAGCFSSGGTHYLCSVLFTIHCSVSAPLLAPHRCLPLGLLHCACFSAVHRQRLRHYAGLSAVHRQRLLRSSCFGGIPHQASAPFLCRRCPPPVSIHY